MNEQDSNGDPVSKLSRLERLTDNIWLLGAGVLLVVLAWIYIPLAMVNWLGTKTLPENTGIIGDMFGTVNALFAGLAFLLLIWSVFQSNRAIKIQQQDLKLQQQELRESREVLSDQAESQKKMIEAITELSKQTELATHVAASSILLDMKIKMVENHQLRVRVNKEEGEVNKDVENLLRTIEGYMKSIPH